MDASSNPESMSEEELEALVKSIGIPAQPALLADVQREMASDDPDPRRLAKLVSQDVAMSAALLKTANSAFFALKRKVETVEQAASYLGLKQCTSILTGLITRKAINAEGPQLQRYWDVSAKRSAAMARMATNMRLCPSDVAHTFGLFCDIGIPMLMKRFPEYMETLKIANMDEHRPFTDIEEQRHGTNHATVGAIMSRSWGLSADLIHAIRVHHDYEVMREASTPKAVNVLVALCLLAERAIQTYQSLNFHVEWAKGGALTKEILAMNDDEVDDCCEELHALFDAEGGA